MKKNFFERYIAYLKDNPEGYWFKRKIFGWGWTPATREGWFLTAALIAAILFIGLRADESYTDREAIIYILLPVFVLVMIFIFIAYKTGEKPKWQFWFPDEEAEDEENSDSQNENM